MAARHYPPEVERFWAKVQRADPNACWLWVGAVDNRNRGQIGQSGKAHRYSWQIHHGQIPVGALVLQTCGNTLCVNPSHLFLSTLSALRTPGPEQRKRASEAREQRFWSKVDKSRGADGCWSWMGGRDAHGYGHFSGEPGGKGAHSIKAHRQAWIYTNGPIRDGLHVLHRCDNPPCVNTAHLFLGTPIDNARDMVSKLRSARGSRHSQATLTEGQVLEIRRLLKRGIPQRDIAYSFGVRSEAIGKIERGQRWGWLADDHYESHG